MPHFIDSTRHRLRLGPVLLGLAIAATICALVWKVADAGPWYGRKFKWRPGSIANGPPGNSATRAAAAQQRALFFQQFDTDRNGQLDGTETLMALKAIVEMQQAQQAMMRGNAANPGGAAGQPKPAPVRPKERNPGDDRRTDPKVQAEPIESFVKLFDKDGDGLLNAQEMAAAKQALARRQKQK